MAFTGADTLMKAIVAFFMSLFLGAAMAVCGGAIIDVTFDVFSDQGFFNVPDEWSSFATYRYLIYLYYAFCCIFPLYGAAYLGVTIYHKYIIEDDWDDEDDEPIYTGGNI